MIELPERVSYDSLTGEVVDQEVLRYLETQHPKDMIVLVCDSCKVRWRCGQDHWHPATRQRCHECGAEKSVHQVGV